MRQRFFWNGTEWGETPRYSRHTGPIIISDALADVRNPVDGKIYDSKSRYQRTLKANGCHVVDAGELAPRKEFRGTTASKDEIRRAAYEVRERIGRAG